MTPERHPSEYRRSLRQRILTVAMTAFTQNGIKAVKMSDIASALSISKRTLYELYDNKEVLLMEAIDFNCRHHQQVVSEFVAGGAGVMDVMLFVFELKVKEFNETSPQFYADVEKYPRLVDYLENLKTQEQDEFIRFLERGTREGFFCEGLNFQLIARLINVQSRYVMAEQLYRKYPMPTIFHNLIYLSLRGLCTPKGIAVLDQFLADYQKKFIL